MSAFTRPPWQPASSGQPTHSGSSPGSAISKSVWQTGSLDELYEASLFVTESQGNEAAEGPVQAPEVKKLAPVQGMVLV